MKIQFRLPAETEFRRIGQVLDTARGEHDTWYTVRDDATGNTHTLPWHMVNR